MEVGVSENAIECWFVMLDKTILLKIETHINIIVY